MTRPTIETSAAVGIALFGILAYAIPNALFVGDHVSVTLFPEAGLAEQDTLWQLAFRLGMTVPPFAAGAAAFWTTRRGRPIEGVLRSFAGASAVYALGLFVTQSMFVGPGWQSTLTHSIPLVLTAAGLFALLATLCSGLGHLIEDLGIGSRRPRPSDR
jgi:hypothetical protein